MTFPQNHQFQGENYAALLVSIFSCVQKHQNGGFWNPDSVVPFALKFGRGAQDYKIFLILEPGFFPLFRSHEKKSSLSTVLPKKIRLIHGAHEPQRHLKSEKIRP